MFLRHTLLVTEVYVTAVEVGRNHRLQLARFATEPECWRHLADGTRIRPDAELHLTGEGYEDSYLIEADRGTEGSGALHRKLDMYRRLFRSGTEQASHGVFPRVLFVTLDERRRSQIASQMRRQPEDIRPIFAVTHLSGLPGVLAWGPDPEPQ